MRKVQSLAEFTNQPMVGNMKHGFNEKMPKIMNAYEQYMAMHKKKTRAENLMEQIEKQVSQ